MYWERTSVPVSVGQGREGGGRGEGGGGGRIESKRSQGVDSGVVTRSSPQRMMVAAVKAATVDFISSQTVR